MPEIEINREWCKGCPICAELCPVDVLKLNDEGRLEVVNEDNCTECMLCELRCPDLAIEIRGENNE